MAVVALSQPTLRPCWRSAIIAVSPPIHRLLDQLGAGGGSVDDDVAPA